MKKGEIYEGIIDHVEYPNKGIILMNEEDILVKNAIPGQKVRFQITKKRSGRLEGRVLCVLEKSPLETREKQCSIFPECGGCMYQTMPYASQLAMKEEQIRRLLFPVLSRYQEDCSWEGILGSPCEFAYRNKMEFSFGDAVKDGPLTLGLHKKGSSYDVLTAADCRLVHPDLNQILTCVLSYFTEVSAPYYHKISHVGYLRHLLLRRGSVTGEILVHLVTTSQEEYPLEPLVEKLLALKLSGSIVGILHLFNDSPSDTVRSDKTDLLWGRDYFMEKLLGLSFRISTFSFFQPNSGAAELLYSKVREYLGDVGGKTVYDLYSGTGTIAQLAASTTTEAGGETGNGSLPSPSGKTENGPLSSLVSLPGQEAPREVVGVEIVEEAVMAARENALRNGITNCRFICGDVLHVLDELTDKPDTIILDPPRDGIHPKALPKIIAYGVPNIVYISCKATSLVRDLPYFLEAGYTVKKACCIDQFSQTVHVETVCLLSNRKPDARVKIDVDLEDYYRIKDEQKKNKASE